MTSTIRRFYFSVVACVVAWTACAGQVQAGLVLNGTRVVYPENAREVTLRVANMGREPVLAQSWIDDGRADVPPERLHVPFVVAPAVARVEPGKGAVLRIKYTHDPLPVDREAVFWLNVLEVPSTRDADANALQFAFRTRIKLFYRPDSLKDDAASAPDRLVWRAVTPEPQADASARGAKVAVEVSNPTPYYVSFGQVESDLGGAYVSAGGGMVAPFSKARFPLPGVSVLSNHKANVRYQSIDDYGGRSTATKALTD
ncbi:molecular chaperone [Burkholderia stagnalis]|uniref:Fimbria/pilus periplasmic chaperone n=1 Tax=Burkholderia stagnalis TaxID=1503054 RepID=A0A3P0FQ79_9BURK|nr:fimbria/pilus periplasmic chaperone [Burkholderia stagnalis]KAB0638717.1 fimbria/pilus periplasmic chaperone [Burkholderia stagnalis]KVM93058.1 molecular chaperone [Burkholderia stagnalis]KVN12063.1 molecular chaperone [Burkholderia stagnalis]KVN58011.1 molecular chaperone [Burkholderia stagnalis]KVO44833.1 molecular chaperone [Burkholderia stagnalis]